MPDNQSTDPGNGEMATTTTQRCAPIPGTNCRYWVTEDGRVFGKRGEMRRAADRDGYARLGIYPKPDGRRVFRRVHCLVMAAFKGPCPPGKQVNHKNGIKNDNRLQNLEYVTPSENRIHAFVNGLSKPIPRDRHVNSKLTSAEAEDVIRAYRKGEAQTAIARRVGVSQTVISRIVRSGNA